jgi:hypothetical protein
VDLALEFIKRNLTHDRVDHVFHLAGQKRLALAQVRGVVQHLAEGQHFAEDRCRFRKR